MRIRKIIYAKKFDGLPKESDFKIVKEDLGDQLNENEFFYKSIFVSCDPYLRAYAGGYTVGETCIPGYQLSKVVESRNTKYPVGSLLVMQSGWRDGGKSDGRDVWYVRNDIPTNVSLSAGFGIFGMTGLTAYYGVDSILKPKPGETIVVSAAAGGIGTVVGQIGKILYGPLTLKSGEMMIKTDVISTSAFPGPPRTAKVSMDLQGCRVIGSCGTEEKIKFVKSIGFDDAFNYKTESVDDALKRLAPKGVDCYFDNVGGDFTFGVLSHMNQRGRVAVCGAISHYNAKEPVRVPQLHGLMISKSLLLQGFTTPSDVNPQADKIYATLKKWTEEGKLKQYEYLTQGFENIPKTFIEMLQGKNIGKTTVKI